MEPNREDVAQQKLRKRRVSYDRAEKARQALEPYLSDLKGDDLRSALTDLLTDYFHLASQVGVDADEETMLVILERARYFFREEEAKVPPPALGGAVRLK